MLSKKGLNSIIAVGLLFIVTVISIVSFQTWYESYSSSINVNIESKSSLIETISIETILYDTLYISSDVEDRIDFLKITNQNGVERCNYQISREGLIGWWDLNEGTGSVISDNSDSNLTGTYQNNSIESEGLWVKGKSGNALFFDKSNPNRVYFGENVLFNPNRSTGFSVSAWVKTLDTFNGAPIFGKDSKWRLLLLGGRPALYLRDSTGTTWQSTPDSLDSILDNNWHLVTGVWDGFNASIYVDGVLKDTEPAADDVHVMALYSGIGNVHSEYFNGTIDEVLMFNRALDPNEIQSLFLFNTLLDLNSGINIINISGCNLTQNQMYKIIFFTENKKVEKTIYFK